MSVDGWTSYGATWYRDIGIFRLFVRPAVIGFRADIGFSNAIESSALIGFYPDLDTAKTRAPGDMRAKILASLAEITEAT